MQAHPPCPSNPSASLVQDDQVESLSAEFPLASRLDDLFKTLSAPALFSLSHLHYRDKFEAEHDREATQTGCKAKEAIVWQDNLPRH